MSTTKVWSGFKSCLDCHRLFSSIVPARLLSAKIFDHKVKCLSVQ